MSTLNLKVLLLYFGMPVVYGSSQLKGYGGAVCHGDLMRPRRNFVHSKSWRICYDYYYYYDQNPVTLWTLMTMERLKVLEAGNMSAR